MKIALIVAVTRNGVIGREGGMPWRLSTDLKRFKAITMGKPIIMGRKTWESIGRPLPGRHNIVISRNPAYRTEGAVMAASLDDALAKAHSLAKDAEEICVIGGGEIFREALPIADVLHVTYIDAEIAGDAFFPQLDTDLWQAVSSEDVPVGEKDIYPTRYVVYQRRSAIGRPAHPIP